MLIKAQIAPNKRQSDTYDKTADGLRRSNKKTKDERETLFIKAGYFKFFTKPNILTYLCIAAESVERFKGFTRASQ